MDESIKKKTRSVYDFGIQETSVDAIRTKKSSILLKYYSDPFLSEFHQKKEKFLPLMNRGTWSRVQSISGIINKFINYNKDFRLKTGVDNPIQIISIGAGLDTQFFNTKSLNKDLNFRYFELDYSEVVQKKIELIKKSNLIQSLLSKKEDFSDLKISKFSFISEEYALLDFDLREINAFDKIIEELNIDTSIPTLIIAECVLVYLTRTDSSNILKYFSLKFPNIGFITYEVINPYDMFGKKMEQNLADRNIKLFGIHETPDIESQIDRFIKNGYSHADAYDMLTIYNYRLNKNEKDRIEKIEMMDEFEEWNIIQSHYCLGLAVNGNDIHYDLPKYLVLENI